MTSLRRPTKTVSADEEVTPAVHPDSSGAGNAKPSPSRAVAEPLQGRLSSHVKNYDGDAAISLEVLSVVPKVDWDRLREEFLVVLEALLEARDWAVSEEIRELLSLVAELVRILPVSGEEPRPDIEDQIKGLRYRIAALRS